MNPKIELKPCPFCGGEAFLFVESGEAIEVSGSERKMSDLIVCVEIDEVMPDA